MASTLKHLRSSTADKRPTASGLVDGQLAINTASGTPALFFKDNNGGVVKVGPAHVGSTAPNAVPAGSAGNSLGELWVDNGLTTPGLNYYTGSAFVNLTPSGTTTTVGLVELATPAETQTGTDAVRAITPSGLQSKVSDSTSTTSSTTIASSTAVKSAYDLANAALPKAGGTVTGELLIGNTGSLVFEGSSDDSFETTIAVVDPTGDRTITFPNVTGTVVTTGDFGTVTSTMIANDTIVNADINSAAAIAYSKLALSSGIVNTDISASAAIVDTKLATISTADKVSISALNIDGATDIGGALEGGDLFIVDDGAGGTNRKAPAFRMSQLAYSGVTGDITIASGGTSAIGAGVIVNADVNASAAIDFSKLASLTSANILLGNASNVATSTAVTGDVTISNTGVTAIASGVIVDADISASAEIAVSKLADGAARQLLQTDAAGTGVEWASNIDIPGTLDVTSAATFDSSVAVTGALTKSGNNVVTVGDTGTVTSTMILDGTILNADVNASAAIAGTKISPDFGSQTVATTGLFSHALGTAGAPTITFTGDTNTGIYSPGADQVAISTNGTNRFQIDSSGNITVDTNTFYVDAANNRVGVGTTSPGATLDVRGNGTFTGNATARQTVDFTNTGGQLYVGVESSAGGAVFTGSSAYAGIVGTNNSTNLQLATNGAVRATLDTSGRLGIGTSSPAFLIDASGSASTGIRYKSTGLYGGVATDNSNATGGGFFAAFQNGIQKSIFGVVGAFAGSTNSDTGVFAETGQGIQFFTNGVPSTPKAVITSAGLVGIGTTSPSNVYRTTINGDGSSIVGGLSLRNNGTETLTIGNVTAANDVDSEIWNPRNGYLRFATNNAERARIDSSGRLLVGTSTSRSNWYNTTGLDNNLQIEGTTHAGSGFSIVRSNNFGGHIELGGHGGTTIGSYTLVSSTANLGSISFQGTDGAEFVEAASIACNVDGTPGSNDMPGRLVFSTTADGASSPTERMRITNAGGVRLPDVYNATIALSANVFIDTDGTLKRATSSIKYKTNVETLEDQYADAVLNCRPVWYQSTSGGDNPEWGYWGFIAEEVAEIDPRLVQWKLVEQIINEDGSRETVPLETPEPENVAYDRFVPHLLNLIKRQSEAIAELQAEVAALKAS